MMTTIDPSKVFIKYLECDKRIRRCVKPCEKCKYSWNNDELKAAMKAVIEKGKENDN